MEIHILVTVTEDVAAMHGVRFVGGFFSHREHLKITLFYVAPRAPVMWEGERTLEGDRHAERLCAGYESKGRAALAAGSNMLVREGFAPDRVFTRLEEAFDESVDQGPSEKTGHASPVALQLSRRGGSVPRSVGRFPGRRPGQTPEEAGSGFAPFHTPMR